MAPVRPSYSKGDINRAGETLRRWKEEGEGLIPEGQSFVKAWNLLIYYRSSYEPVLDAVGLDLIQVASSFPGHFIGRRLKRVDRIIEKLTRFPGMKLARMEDIGGYRVVVPTLADVEAFVRRALVTLGRVDGDTKVGHDYITTPKKSGYRAIHIFLKRDDRCIEVQVRTTLQHSWAMLVEEQENRSGQKFKDGIGDLAVLDKLRDFGDALAYRDRDEVIPPELVERLRASDGAVQLALPFRLIEKPEL